MDIWRKESKKIALEEQEIQQEMRGTEFPSPDTTQRGTEFASSSMTMEERYTKAMCLMGYKLTDTPIDSMATVTFIRGSDGQDAIRSDGWEGVGYVLEERLPGLKGKLASEIKALLYPQGNPEDVLCAPEPEASDEKRFFRKEMLEERAFMQM